AEELFHRELHRGLARELALRPLGGGLQPLERLRVAARIDPVRVAEAIAHRLREHAIYVFTAEEGVAGGGEHLEDVVLELEDGDVEGPSAEIVDRDALALSGAVAVRERGGRGLVEDAQDLEAGDLAG